MSRCRSSKLPAYVERVPLARRKKPDTRLTVGIEIGVMLLAIWAGAFVYYRSHELPYYVTKLYAHLGSSEAQHILSQYHLSRRHEDPEHARQAEHWLNKAAEAKHPIAAYNLALAHIRGDLPSNMTPDASHVHGLLTHAINQGVHEAMGLIHMCGHGQCFKQQRRKREQERKQREEETKAKASDAKKP
nr:Sel1 [Hymenolepis microstoma]